MRVKFTSVMRDRIALIIGMVILWQLVDSFGWVDQLVIPSPWQVILSFGQLVATPSVTKALLGTLAAFAVAFVIASVLGTIIGIALGVSDSAYRLIYSSVAWLNGIPKLVFLPVFVLALGIGYTFQIVYATIAAILPVIVTVTPGIRSVDERLVVAARSMGASGWRIGWKVLLPASVPAFVTALWYASEYALLGVVLTELFISPNGVGSFIRDYTSAFRPDKVFALLLVLALVGTIVGVVVQALSGEKRWTNQRS